MQQWKLNANYSDKKEEASSLQTECIVQCKVQKMTIISSAASSLSSNFLILENHKLFKEFITVGQT